MLGVRHSSSPIRLRPKLVRPARGCLLLLLLLPVGLLGQETRQVTLYTPDGSQQRLLSAPLVVNVKLPVPPLPEHDPVSEVIGTGTGTRRTGMEVVVRDSAGGQSTISYANGKIGALAADPSGNVWVATSAGLSRFDSGQWTTFTQADGLADDHIHSVVVDGQGQVWAGSLNGLSRFDSQHWTRYRFEERWDREIAIAPNGDMWCTGGQDFLLARFDGQAWWTYDYADMGVVDSEPWWTYAIGLLERFDEEGGWWKEANLTRGFRSVHVSDIAVDRSGTLWAVLEFYKPKGTSGEHIAVLNHLRVIVYCINLGNWQYFFCRMPLTNRSLICSKQVVHNAWERTKVLPFNQRSSTGFSCGV